MWVCRRRLCSSLTSSASSSFSSRLAADATTALHRLDARRRVPHANAPRHRGRMAVPSPLLLLRLPHFLSAAAPQRATTAGAAKASTAPDMLGTESRAQNRSGRRRQDSDRFPPAKSERHSLSPSPLTHSTLWLERRNLTNQYPRPSVQLFRVHDGRQGSRVLFSFSFSFYSLRAKSNPE